MGFVKYVSEGRTEYQGESFSASLKKDTGEAWLEVEQGTFKLIAPSGAVVSQGDLDKSGDSIHLFFVVPGADTSDLVGDCLLLVYQTDSSNPQVNDVIAEYHIEYKRERP